MRKAGYWSKFMTSELFYSRKVELTYRTIYIMFLLLQLYVLKFYNVWWCSVMYIIVIQMFSDCKYSCLLNAQNNFAQEFVLCWSFQHAFSSCHICYYPVFSSLMLKCFASNCRVSTVVKVDEHHFMLKTLNWSLLTLSCFHMLEIFCCITKWL